MHSKERIKAVYHPLAYGTQTGRPGGLPERKGGRTRQTNRILY